MKTSFLALFTGLLLAGTATHSRADILVNSDFDAGYTPGALNGQSGTNDVGLAGTYTADNNATDGSGVSLNVVSGGLDYNNGSVSIPGGTQSVQFTSSTGAVTTPLSRNLSSTIGGAGINLYERIVINIAPGTGGGGSYAALTIGLADSTGHLSYNRTAGVGFNPGSDGGGQFSANAAYFYTNAYANSNVSIATSPGTHLLVAEFVSNGDPGGNKYNTVNFFLDPTSTSQGTPIATATSGDSYGNFSVFGMGIANLSGSLQFDSVAVGTSFADVVTAAAVPEPGTWMGGAVLLLGTASLVLRRRLA